MSAGEFAFLALGLVLGVATGAALVEVLRSRPPTPREIRLTVTPDAIPRRPAATLSTGAFATSPGEPARGGPADRRETDRLETGRPEPDRDFPPNDPPPGRLVPALQAPTAAPTPQLLSATAASGPRGSLVGIAIHSEPDPALAALGRLAAATARRATKTLVAAGAVASAERLPAAPPPLQGSAGASGAEPEAAPETGSDGDLGAAGADTTEEDGTGPCPALRRAADERCTLATRARGEADSAREALRTAQRRYDDHLTRAERAAADADPRAIRAAKEAAQQRFREARSAARDRDGVEAAARDWLTEINRINLAARDATVQIERERGAARELVVELERLTVAADAARIAAESADAACVRAREAVADCEEEATARSSAGAQPATGGGDWTPGTALVPPSFGQATGVTDGGTQEAPALVLVGGGDPAILRMVRGDRAVLAAVAGELAAGDPAERRRWQAALAGLVEAIVARAIEASALDFPVDHPFWGPFTLMQNRDIAAALASLGYRFDGLGGWADERVPTQRDLTLAVGYAGLDPMRIRRWPSEGELVELFRDVTVTADEYLIGAAAGMTLGEFVSLLGLRADGLTDLWNEWGRVRPLLLATG